MNDTFHNNTAQGGVGGNASTVGNPGSGYGGAVFAVNGTLTATFVTFSGNTADDGESTALDSTDLYVLADGGETGVNGSSASVTLTDDILGQATSATGDFVASNINSASLPAMSGQYDLISNNGPTLGGASGFAGASVSEVTTDVAPPLAGFGDNGGPTDTIPLVSPLPGIAVNGITVDQRGVARLFVPDIGAYEYSSPTITVSPSSLPLGTTTAGTPGTEESYTISGLDLTENLTITAPAGVEISDDGGMTWTASLSFTPASGIVTSTTIESRLSASAPVGPLSGSITNTSAVRPRKR